MATNTPARKATISTPDARRDLEDAARDLKTQIKSSITCHRSSPNQQANIKELATKNLRGDMLPILPHACSTYPGQASGNKDNPYHEATRALDGLRVLLKEYEEISKRGCDIRMPSWVRWEQDGTDLQLLNTSLMGHCLKHAEQSIIPSGSRAPPNIGNEDVDQIASELLQETWPPTTEETWGDATKGILQSMLGIAAFLP
ncbi:uncharacterized protein MAM_06228 [Metarhizium album ARSEF 1941]|uniref:Uncharacterized protein n=1 Tax=Metarhizium album (strain ARSEF 1941) TaxID=1081103 RepID=A0A0B2WIK7_METAS|nr:uncharacterized protein MAM_06228 [Metarhizium album ARSEF 1941]KHN95866.1 hypothetical protein MAM_06228 [Metarhizium album ARSEF 1941]